MATSTPRENTRALERIIVTEILKHRPAHLTHFVLSRAWQKPTKDLRLIQTISFAAGEIKQFGWAVVRDEAK